MTSEMQPSPLSSCRRSLDPEPSAPAEVLADIPKNRRETLRITRETYRGHEFVQIRVWFTAEDGELRPGKSGVSVQPDKLDAVIAALQTARLKDGPGAL